eukprot:604682-Prymnesium_polylepis.1
MRPRPARQIPATAAEAPRASPGHPRASPDQARPSATPALALALQQGRSPRTVCAYRDGRLARAASGA